MTEIIKENLNKLMDTLHSCSIYSLLEGCQFSQIDQLSQYNSNPNPAKFCGKRQAQFKFYIDFIKGEEHLFFKKHQESENTRRPKLTFLQRTNTEGQQAHEKMLNIANF